MLLSSILIKPPFGVALDLLPFVKVKGWVVFALLPPKSSLFNTSITLFILFLSTVTASSNGTGTIGRTVIFTVVVTVSPFSSSIVYVKLSGPLYVAFGV